MTSSHRPTNALPDMDEHKDGNEAEKLIDSSTTGSVESGTARTRKRGSMTRPSMSEMMLEMSLRSLEASLVEHHERNVSRIQAIRKSNLEKEDNMVSATAVAVSLPSGTDDPAGGKNAERETPQGDVAESVSTIGVDSSLHTTKGSVLWENDGGDDTDSARRLTDAQLDEDGNGVDIEKQTGLTPSQFKELQTLLVPALLPEVQNAMEEEEIVTSGVFSKGGFTELSEDVFSFMFLYKVNSDAMKYAVFVFFLQVAVLGLIMSDLIDTSSDNNPVQIPPGVDPAVRVAQFCAIIISVATSEDVIVSLVSLLDGYNPKILDTEPAAFAWKFYLSNFCRLMEGFLFLVVVFLVIIQSSEIIGLFLNLAALNFVSTLDDTAFDIARHGFVTDSLQKKADVLADLPIPVLRSVSNVFRRVFLFSIFVFLVIGWSVAVSRQKSGRYLCQTFSVEFGEEATPDVAQFTGIYEKTGRKDSTGRYTFVSERTTGNNSTSSSNSMFAFCEADTTWTFTALTDDKTEENADPCDWDARMIENEAFDMTTISPSEWFVWNQDSEKGGPVLYHFSSTCAGTEGVLNDEKFRTIT